MTEFSDQDLSGARFRRVDLTESWFRAVDLSRSRLVGVDMVDTVIDGWIDGLIVNDVEVAPLVEAELDRRDPERAMMRPVDADGYRAAWPVLLRRWEETVARARALPPQTLDEQVDEEWSFIETLRHLVFVTDAWVARAVLGEPFPWHPLGLTSPEMAAREGVSLDLDATPSLDEVLNARAERQALVSRVIAELTDEQLAAATEPVPEPGYPDSISYPVRRCLGAILNEEYLHRQFAERDLAILARRAQPSTASSPSSDQSV